MPADVHSAAPALASSSSSISSISNDSINDSKSGRLKHLLSVLHEALAAKKLRTDTYLYAQVHQDSIVASLPSDQNVSPSPSPPLGSSTPRSASQVALASTSSSPSISSSSSPRILATSAFDDPSEEDPVELAPVVVPAFPQNASAAASHTSARKSAATIDQRLVRSEPNPAASTATARSGDAVAVAAYPITKSVDTTHSAQTDSVSAVTIAGESHRMVSPRKSVSHGQLLESLDEDDDGIDELRATLLSRSSSTLSSTTLDTRGPYVRARRVSLPIMPSQFSKRSPLAEGLGSEAAAKERLEKIFAEKLAAASTEIHPNASHPRRSAHDILAVNEAWMKMMDCDIEKREWPAHLKGKKSVSGISFNETMTIQPFDPTQPCAEVVAEAKAAVQLKDHSSADPWGQFKAATVNGEPVADSDARSNAHAHVHAHVHAASSGHVQQRGQQPPTALSSLARSSWTNVYGEPPIEGLTEEELLSILQMETKQGGSGIRGSVSGEPSDWAVVVHSPPLRSATLAPTAIPESSDGETAEVSMRDTVVDVDDVEGHAAIHVKAAAAAAATTPTAGGEPETPQAETQLEEDVAVAAAAAAVVAPQPFVISDKVPHQGSHATMDSGYSSSRPSISEALGHAAQWIKSVLIRRPSASSHHANVPLGEHAPEAHDAAHALLDAGQADQQATAAASAPEGWDKGSISGSADTHADGATGQTAAQARRRRLFQWRLWPKSASHGSSAGTTRSLMAH
ncbi:hypothetical protein BC831DRAFT_446236 [Entophlyctis helioformis]|nr:hypothetical protein BC831DRAFT_446236 [Entophlyctis helioformis]